MVRVKIRSLGVGLQSTILKGETKLVVGETHELPDHVAAFLPHSDFEYDVLSGDIPKIVVKPASLKALALQAAKAAAIAPKDATVPLSALPVLPKEAVAALIGKDALAAAKAGTLDKVAGEAAVVATMLGLGEVAAELAKRAKPKEG